MKEHIQARFVNELRDTAKSHEGCESLREALASVVAKYVNPQSKKQYCPKCRVAQEYKSNPYYMHICTNCGEKYGPSDLINL